MENILIFKGSRADAFQKRIRLIAKAFKMERLEVLPDDGMEDKINELSNKLLQADGDILNLNSEIETLKEANIRLIEEKKTLTDKVAELEGKLSKIKVPDPQPAQTTNKRR